jgi:hypothetical protein
MQPTYQFQTLHFSHVLHTKMKQNRFQLPGRIRILYAEISGYSRALDLTWAHAELRNPYCRLDRLLCHA